MKIEPIEHQIKRMIAKIEGQPTEQYWYDRNVEKLSLKMIKLKFGWLFNPRTVNPKWKWNNPINNYHIITECPKTIIWRIKWNYRSRAINGQKITEILLNDNPDGIEFQLIDLMNKAVEELTKIYLEYI